MARSHPVPAPLDQSDQEIQMIKPEDVSLSSNEKFFVTKTETFIDKSLKDTGRAALAKSKIMWDDVRVTHKVLAHIGNSYEAMGFRTYETSEALIIELET